MAAERFGLALGRAMVREHVSFRALASRTGLSPSYLCLLAGGKRRPSPASARAIVAALPALLELLN